MKAVYLGLFDSKEDVLKQFEAPEDALKGAKVLLAWYGSGSYCGSAFVLFERDGELFEVNGSHCSCYGIEGLWSPEVTNIKALEKRTWGGSYGDYDYEQDAGVEMKRILKTLKRRALQ